MRIIKQTRQFKKDLKRESKGQYRQILQADFVAVIQMLAQDQTLPIKYRDHALTGQWQDFRDCHIKPDLVLIYQKTDEDELLILSLVRLGSHSELDLG